MQAIELLKAAISISAASTTATALLNHFAARQRNRKVENVTHLVTVCGKGTKRQAVIDVLRELESRGFGQFVHGRKGYDSRFVWGDL